MHVVSRESPREYCFGRRCFFLRCCYFARRQSKEKKNREVKNLFFFVLKTRTPQKPRARIKYHPPGLSANIKKYREGALLLSRMRCVMMTDVCGRAAPRRAAPRSAARSTLHAHSPVLDGGAGVEELSLDVHGDALGRQLVDLHDRGVADCCGC